MSRSESSSPASGGMRIESRGSHGSVEQPLSIMRGVTVGYFDTTLR